MPKKGYEPGSYGAYLVALIKAHNFSQAEFAKRIDVSRTYVYNRNDQYDSARRRQKQFD